MSTSPEHWFLSSEASPRGYTEGNNVEAFVDGCIYFSDLKVSLEQCDKSLLIAGWRVSSGQILDPQDNNGTLSGESWLDAVRKVRAKGADVRALLFNVPGTNLPGPFRLWHALDNRDFCDQLIGLGGEAILDNRISPVPASSHHQKFIVSISDDPNNSAAYLGGIDVCYDRWDQPAHDQAPERQRDFVRGGGLETHEPSQPGWHDVQVKIQGPALAQIWDVFRHRWNDPRKPNHDPLLSNYCGKTRIETTEPKMPAMGTMSVQINLTLPEGVFPADGGPGELTIARAQEHAIDQAEHYIYVEDQYVWPCSLVERLEAALQRGVRVLLVVARDYDAPGLSIVSRRLRGEVIDRLRAAAPELFRVHHLERPNGEQIYVHAKLIIIDDRFVSVGSANFNARSLINDTEIQASIVDGNTFDSVIAGKPERVCRFAYDLRCRLWAEHLETGVEGLHDPIRAIDEMWSKAPLAPSHRAVPHVVKIGLFEIDPIAEFLTTVITKQIAVVPSIPMPPGVTERSAVKLLVDTGLRGPLAAGSLKFLEEMLNPDVNSTFSAIRRAVLHPAEGLPSMLQPPQPLTASTASSQHAAEAEAVIRDLRNGKLPTMVDWIDPILLGAVAVRTMISSTIGQYADQRPMQAAMDVCSPEELRARHDYSGVPPSTPQSSGEANAPLTADAQGRVWLDFIADLGDGFEATYAMAYLLAASHIDVKKSKGEALKLPAGEVLVFGGDLAYPNATIKEYTDRCLTPYDMAFRTDAPKRQLFYIAGNHDWYDGLTAFTSVFCTARDRYTHGLGKQIGGWQCHQRRSYFALRMPHDWWIWGVDLGLTDAIDDAQLDYFHTMSEATKPGDKVIIITHAPGWVNKSIGGLHEMTMLARSRGADVPVVLAGDLHHYSRYHSDAAGVHMITSGGGGAFAHATHQLKSRMSVDWAVATGEPTRRAQATDSAAFNRQEREAVPDGGNVDFTEKAIVVEATKSSERGTVPGVAPSLKIAAREFTSPNFYPPRWKSRLLVLKNLWLPFHNRRFAVMLGLIYMVFGWLFQLSVADPIEQIRKSQYAGVEVECLAKLKVGAASDLMTRCKADAYKRIDDVVSKLLPATPVDESRVFRAPAPNLKGEFTAEQQQKLTAYLKTEVQTLWQELILTVSPKRVVIGMLNNPAFFIAVLGLWLGLIHYVDVLWNNRALKLVTRIALGTMHFLAHMGLLLIITSIFTILVYSPMVDARNEFWTVVGGVGAYTALIILFGGLFGGLVWGAYWALTSAFFGMHMDAFSALGIANYKNFLRMSFEPDRLTIYPIGVDKIPGRRGWRTPRVGEQLPSHNPLILPKRSLVPKLIEEPIVIEARKRPVK